MKNFIKRLSTIVLALVLLQITGSAQDIKGGSVKYEEMTYYEFNYTPTGNSQRDNFFANLPKGKRVGKILHFNENRTLYATDPDARVEVLEGRQGMFIERMSLGSPPNGVLQTAYLDTKKGERIDVVELMTRLFQVKNKLVTKAWKPGREQKKILNYVCQNASYKDGDKTVTAWFTTEIPYSYGPGKYLGLPGLILAVEVDGKNHMLAIEIDLNQADKAKIAKPSEGKKISQKEYDTLLKQKVEEWEKQKNSGQTDRR